MCLLANAIADELKVDVVFKPDKCDRKTKAGDQLSMHYTGTLEDGTKFDSSVDRDQPFTFQLGVGQVIKGWDQGLLDMCVGEKRKLTIPAKLGYGDKGAGNKIPGGATLLFDVECLSISDGEKPKNVFKEIDTDGDNQLSREEISGFIRKQEAAQGSQSASVKDHDNMLNEIFQSEDKDKDGVISFDEFSGPKHDEL